MAKLKQPIDAARTAQLLAQLDDFFEEKGGFDTTSSRIKALEDLGLIDLKKIELKAINEAVDLVKAQQERMEKQIRAHRGGLYVSGIEDQKVSLLKCSIAIWNAQKLGGSQKSHFEKIGAGHEWEILHNTYKQHGEQLGLMSKGQKISDDSLGGAFIPDQVIAHVVQAIYTRSIFINLTGEGTQRVSVVAGLTGGNVKIPKFEGGMIAYWQGEDDVTAESQVKTSDMNMVMKKLGVLAKITEDMRLFASYGFENLFRRDMIRAMAKKLDLAIGYGKGTDFSPRGIMNTTGVKVWSAEKGDYAIIGDAVKTLASMQADWAGAELDFDGLMRMRLALNADNIELDESSALLSAYHYFLRLKLLKVDNYTSQTTNRPYLLGMPMLSDAKLKDLIGEFDSSTQFPIANKPGASVGAPTTSAVVKFGDVITGNLSEVLMGQWSGLEITDDGGVGTGFAGDTTLVKGRLRVDVQVRQPRALIVCPDAKMVD